MIFSSNTNLILFFVEYTLMYICVNASLRRCKKREDELKVTKTIQTNYHFSSILSLFMKAGLSSPFKDFEFIIFWSLSFSNDPFEVMSFLDLSSLIDFCRTLIFSYSSLSELSNDYVSNTVMGIGIVPLI